MGGCCESESYPIIDFTGVSDAQIDEYETHLKSATDTTEGIKEKVEHIFEKYSEGQDFIYRSKMELILTELLQSINVYLKIYDEFVDYVCESLDSSEDMLMKIDRNLMRDYVQHFLFAVNEECDREKDARHFGQRRYGGRYIRSIHRGRGWRGRGFFVPRRHHHRHHGHHGHHGGGHRGGGGGGGRHGGGGHGGGGHG
jgi:hypothetical protein